MERRRKDVQPMTGLEIIPTAALIEEVFNRSDAGLLVLAGHPDLEGNEVMVLWHGCGYKCVGLCELAHVKLMKSVAD